MYPIYNVDLNQFFGFDPRTTNLNNTEITSIRMETAQSKH